MGLTSAGLDFLAYTLCNGNKLALGTNSSTPLTVGYRNYADVSINWSQSAGGDGTSANMYSSGGVLKNYNTFYFNDADDTSGQTSNGWGTISYLFIVDSHRDVLYSGALTTPVNVPQDTRPKFLPGSSTTGIQITFTATETT